MKWLGAAKTGRVELDEAAKNAAEYLRSDPDNLVSRLCCAVIMDMQATADPLLGPRPAERFDKMSAVVAGSSPAKVTTLYNRELTKQWYSVLSRRLPRPDVAAAYAQHVPPVQIGGSRDAHVSKPPNRVGPIETHVGLLLFIRDRLTALAADLRAAGRDDAAETCRQWLAGVALGLLETEPDPATRLLCAELLAETLDADSPAAASLRQLRADYRAAAARAPVDLGDGRPAVDPSAYERALLTLAASSAFALPAVGAAGLFGLTCATGIVVGLFGRLRASRRTVSVESVDGRGQRAEHAAASRIRTPAVRPGPSRPTTCVVDQNPGRKAGAATAYDLRRGFCFGRRRVPARFALACLPAAVLAIGVALNLANYGYHSTVWAAIAAASGLAVGALTACLLASAWPESGWVACLLRSRHGPRCIVAGVTLIVLALLPGILPAPFVARLVRGADVAVGVAPVAVVGIVVMGLAGVFIARPRLRMLATAAMLTWCANITCAFVIYQAHRLADRTYQQSAAVGRLDEFPARLGADWQDKYLGPVRKLLAENEP